MCYKAMGIVTNTVEQRMDAMAAQLRETYAQKDTDDLIDLRARGDLTDVAQRILDEELARRGVAQSSVDEAKVRHEADRAEMANAVSNLAGLGARFLAKLIDLSVAAAMLIVINFSFGLGTTPYVADRLAWFSILLALMYGLFKDGFSGQSVGKRVLGIRAVECASGEPCSLPRSFLRNMTGGLGVIDVVFIFGEGRRRLGDILADTCVVRA